MSLEDVKVKDSVLVHFNGQLSIERVKYVGVKTFRTDATRSYYKSTGCHSNGGKWAEHYYTVWRIATETDIATVASAEQAREEKRERARRLNKWLRGVLVDSTLDDTVVSFTFTGCRYEIREVAAHREE